MNGDAAVAGYPAFVWFLANNPKLSKAATRLIRDSENDVFVSAVSAWELATKVRTGKWEALVSVGLSFRSDLAVHGFCELAITVEHGCLAGSMPGIHRDPFDRMLAAQSKIERIPIISIDARLDEVAIARIW